VRWITLLLVVLMAAPAGASDEDDSKWTDGGSVLRPRDGVTNETPRTGYSATPPCTCGSGVCLGGTIWTDSDTDILYLCDEGRSKWLSVSTIALWGEENAACAAGDDLDTSSHCTVDWGDSLGPDKFAQNGLYIPRDATIVSYGYSSDWDHCTSGSFDLELWGSGTPAQDGLYTLEGGATLATDAAGQTSNSASLNVDIDGPQYLMWGIDNSTPGCGQAIDDFNIILYLKWRTS